MNSNFDKYLSNLAAHKDKFPNQLYEFAANPEHYELNHSKSLHDSWVTSVTIAEDRNKQRPFEASLSIALNLLGQQHDREITIIYKQVRHYELTGNENELNSTDTFHGDILTHEVSFINEIFQHVIEFRSGSVFKVVFGKFDISERVFT